jgi:glycine cleavage system H lipoate-binding protein
MVAVPKALPMENTMSILFVLLTFIVVIAVNYFYFRVPDEVPVETKITVRPKVPVFAKDAGFSIPEGYSFHPGHTWVVREAGENARVGLDKFAAELVGKLDRIEVASPSRWVRQGQRLATLHSDGVAFDIVSPVEGVIMEINKDIVADPALAGRDPYKDGWIAVLKSPDLTTNQKNLLRGPMVAPWMHYNVSRLNAALAKMNPAFAQDGGVPIKQAMENVEPALREKLAKEFFLN